MKPTLSIVLPVRNAHATLADQVHELLELAQELTNRFELLIVDDGSTDHTDEVAEDLSRRFPQVTYVRHSRTLGYAAAVKTALDRTNGETILVQEENARLSPGDLRRLWSMRHDDQLVTARAPGIKPLGNDLLQKLGLWGRALKTNAALRSSGGLQMIRRAAIEELSDVDEPAQDLTVIHALPAETVRPMHFERKRKPAVGFTNHLKSMTTRE